MIRRGTLVSRLVAVALMVAVLGAVLLVVAVPLAERWADLRERRVHAAEMAQRLQAIAAGREARAAELGDARAAIAGAGLYLEAETRALAGARMGERLREIAERHGAEIRSVRVIDGSEADREAGRVTLNVAVRGQWVQLFPVIHAIESGEPYFFVRSFTISARGQRRARTSVEETPLLELQFDLYGYLPPEVTG